MPDSRDVRAGDVPSPYKGLVPYNENDAPYFFGRDHERQIITDNLQAARLTLVYGESGVGKTSVLRAGVVHQLRRQARAARARWLDAERAADPDAELERPSFVVVEYATWRDDPLIGLPIAIEASARLIYGERTPEPPPETRHLDELIQGWTERLGADLLLIFDQFEEYLLYHARSDGEGTFAGEFAKAVARSDLRANFVVAIREDSLAKLDRFKGRINFLANYYRVRHLDRSAARDAIVKPLDRYNATSSGAVDVTIEPELVERVLDDVAHGQVLLGQAGRGVVVTDDGPGDRVEAPYLQLVMDRLWREEKARGSTVLRLSTLDELGGAQRIVRTHLDNAMEELPPDKRELAARVFRYLVTPGGTKIALSAADLSDYADVPADQITEVLEDLANARTRILRSAKPADWETEARYEIYHDVLAPPILDWRARFEEERRRLETEASAKRESEARVAAFRRRVGRFSLIGLVVVAIAVVTIVGVLGQIHAAELARAQAGQSDKDAKDAKTRSDAEHHVEQALSELDADPQISLAHALMAWQIMQDANLKPNPGTETAIRLALSKAHLSNVINPPSGGTDKQPAFSAAAYSPDGTRLIAARSDDTATIVDAASGAILHTLTGHSDIVLDASFSPDGHRVVTVSRDGTAKVWDAATGELVWTLAHGDGVPSLAQTASVDRTGRYMATGAFSRDGRYLVTAAGTSAWIWDLQTGKLTRELVHDDSVFSASFSPDGTSILTAGGDGKARIWDVQTGKLRGTPMDNATDWINAATYSPNGKVIACANQDGSVLIWDPATDKELAIRGDHIGQVLTVRFSADSREIVSTGGKTAIVLDVSALTDDDPTTSGASIRSTIHQQASWIDSADLSPDGSYVVTANQDGTARVSDTATGEELFALRGHRGIVWTARFRPDGKSVATASEDGTVRLWNVETGVVLRDHAQAVNSVEFSPGGGTTIVTASTDQSAATWDASTGRRIKALKGTERIFGLYSMDSATFADGGASVLTAQADGTVGLWDPASGTRTGTCCQDLDAVGDYFAPTRAAFVPGHSDRAVVTYDDGTIRVWDLRTTAAAQPVHTFGSPLDRVYAFAIDPKGDVIVTAGRDDKMAHVWRADWTSNTFEAMSMEVPIGLVSNLAFSPDGSRIVTAGLDGVVRVWDLAGGMQVMMHASDEMRIASGAVMFATYDSDGARILAAGTDGVVRIWDAESATFLADIQVHGATVNWIDTAPDGRIATASDDHSAKVFECRICVPTDEVIDLAQKQSDLTPGIVPPEDMQP